MFEIPVNKMHVAARLNVPKLSGVILKIKAKEGLIAI